MRCIIRFAITVMIAACLASTAQATILPGGGLTKLTPPPLGDSADFFDPTVIEHDNVIESAMGGALDGVLLGFDEQKNVLLTDPLSVDVLAGQAGPGVLAAGSKVSSHYIFFDPKSWKDVTATITFDEPVVAIITSTGNLLASDFLGVAGITYNTPQTFPYPVGLGLESGDSATITGTYTIQVYLSTLSGDFLRVLTVPEPSTFIVWSLLAACGIGVGMGRRKRRAA